jgi:hypothetical protein
VVTAVHPVLGLATVLAVILAWAVFVRPDVAVVAFVFLLYSNVVVVAVRFHGLPKVVGSAFPLLLAIPIVRNFIVRRERIVVTSVLPLACLFLCVNLIGLAFARDAERSKSAVMDLVLEGITVYFLVTNAVRRPETLRLATWALLLAGFVVSLVPVYQQFTGSFDEVYGGFGQTSELGFRTGEKTAHGEVRQPRLCGTLDEQNRFAQILLVVLPLGYLRLRDERSRGLRALALLFTAFAGAGFLLTFSRGGAVGLTLLLLVMLCLGVIRRRHAAAIVLALLLVAAAVPQFFTRLMTIQGVQNVLSNEASAGEAADGALKGRTTEMLAAVQVFADHPLVGVGPDMFPLYSQEYGNALGIRRLEGARESHSLFLGIAAETGVLGLGCFLGMLVAAFRGLALAHRRWAGDPEYASLATSYGLALAAYLAAGLFLHMSYIRFFYLILALAGAASHMANLEPLRNAPFQPAGPGARDPEAVEGTFPEGSST